MKRGGNKFRYEDSNSFRGQGVHKTNSRCSVYTPCRSTSSSICISSLCKPTIKVWCCSVYPECHCIHVHEHTPLSIQKVPAGQLYNFHNNREVLTKDRWILETVRGYQIDLLSEDGFFSTLFLVPKTDGGQRLVVNLKAVNNFVLTPHFKMEGILTLKNLLRPRDCLAKVDLKDA